MMIQSTCILITFEKIILNIYVFIYYSVILILYPLQCFLIISLNSFSFPNPSGKGLFTTYHNYCYLLVHILPKSKTLEHLNHLTSLSNYLFYILKQTIFCYALFYESKIGFSFNPNITTFTFKCKL